jgi:hypothetical protein
MKNCASNKPHNGARHSATSKPSTFRLAYIYNTANIHTHTLTTNLCLCILMSVVDGKKIKFKMKLIFGFEEWKKMNE